MKRERSGTERTSWLWLVYGFLVNAVVFLWLTARVLTVLNVRSAIRIFVICTTPAATMGFDLARNIIFQIVIAATLAFSASGRHREVCTVLSHPGFRRVVVETKKEGLEVSQGSKYRDGDRSWQFCQRPFT